jgi:hypothetical protein
MVIILNLLYLNNEVSSLVTASNYCVLSFKLFASSKVRWVIAKLSSLVLLTLTSPHDKT